VQSVGGTPLENLITDFTEMPQVQGCRYLFVYLFRMGGSLPKWAEVSMEVARCLLKDIIPQFGIPVFIGSANGPAFMTKVVQLVAKGLGISWNLHTAYNPQSSGKAGP
jgi:hypothetical protein